jgi:hypothetical protein
MFSLQGAGKNDSRLFGERSMKKGLSVVAAVTFALVAAAADAQTKSGAAKASAEQPTLRVTGPVEAYDSKHGVARVLGQTVALPRGVDVVVGDSASVVGTSASDGKIIAASVKDQGLYVAGSSPIFLAGSVQKVNASVGTAVVSGVTVEFTALMADGPVSPAVGAAVQVGGTQPAAGGVVLASSISGGGMTANSISGGGVAAKSISGGGLSANSISGGGMTANSISGGGVTAKSISGGGLSANSISGGGMTANSISGGGVTAKSISGGGATAKSISGGGLSANSISGGGMTANSISGGGVTAKSISGGGVKANSISGGGL